MLFSSNFLKYNVNLLTWSVIHVYIYITLKNSGTPNFLLQSHASNRKQLWRTNLKINSDRPFEPGINDFFFSSSFCVFLFVHVLFWGMSCVIFRGGSRSVFHEHWREILHMKPKFCKYTLCKCNIDKISTVIEEIEQSMYY